MRRSKVLLSSMIERFLVIEPIAQNYRLMQAVHNNILMYAESNNLLIFNEESNAMNKHMNMAKINVFIKPFEKFDHDDNYENF